MPLYTSGKYAKAICDRCGVKVRYLQLIEEPNTGLKVCAKCFDPKTKQEYPDHFPVDPESLKDPRPDRDVEAGNGTIRPGQEIGAAFGNFKLSVQMGEITVTVT